MDLILTKPEILNRGIFKDNDELWITSLQVAEEFQKNHQHVLRKINNLIKNNELEKFNQSNFGQISYIDESNRTYPAFEMTETGYYTLITGFTGKKADIARAKLAYDFIQLKKIVKDIISPSDGINQIVMMLTNLQAKSQEKLAHHTGKLDTHECKLVDLDKDIKAKSS